MKKTVTWVVVADGARARLFVNHGPGKGLNALPNADFSGPNIPARDIGADRPGRTFDRSGDGRHAKEPRSDPQRVEKRDFLHFIAQHLRDAHNRQEYDRLVLVAPPQALGDLRACLDNGVRTKISGELNKDLTHLKDHELAKPIGRVLAV